MKYLVVLFSMVLSGTVLHADDLEHASLSDLLAKPDEWKCEYVSKSFVPVTSDNQRNSTTSLCSASVTCSGIGSNARAEARKYLTGCPARTANTCPELADCSALADEEAKRRERIFIWSKAQPAQRDTHQEDRLGRNCSYTMEQSPIILYRRRGNVATNIESLCVNPVTCRSRNQESKSIISCAPTGTRTVGSSQYHVCPSANDCSYDTAVTLEPALTPAESAALTRNNGNPTGNGSSSTATETASAAGGERERGTGGRSH